MRSIVPLATMLTACGAAAAEPSGGGVRGHVTVVFDANEIRRDEVWVYLERDPKQHVATKPKPPARAIGQRNRQFEPHVLVVPVGTVVAFPNYDNIEHNVFSATEGWDLSRYSHDDKGKTKSFDYKGEHEIYCDIHKEMWARVKVVDAEPRNIVKVDGAGHYALTDVPAGKYKLHVWTYDNRETVEKISVVDGATAEMPDLRLVLTTDKLKTHTHLDQTPYRDPYKP